MFWNAIVRKGKKGDSSEEDMDVVVAIHNNMNENTWKLVCVPPSLIRLFLYLPFFLLGHTHT